jgi:hypothetical protein
LDRPIITGMPPSAATQRVIALPIPSAPPVMIMILFSIFRLIELLSF